MKRVRAARAAWDLLGGVLFAILTFVAAVILAAMAGTVHSWWAGR